MASYPTNHKEDLKINKTANRKNCVGHTMKNKGQGKKKGIAIYSIGMSASSIALTYKKNITISRGINAIKSVDAFWVTR